MQKKPQQQFSFLISCEHFINSLSSLRVTNLNFSCLYLTWYLTCTHLLSFLLHAEIRKKKIYLGLV